MNFSLIIPNLNGAEFLPSCLNSINKAIKQTPKNNYQIILVDNGSSDDSVSKIKKFIKPFSLQLSPLRQGEIKRGFDFKLIINSSNLGFAQAVNQGILASKYNLVVPCNNDLRLSPDWFKIITPAIESHPQTTAYFGTVLNQNGTRIESQGLQFFIKGKCLNINNGKKFLRSTIYNLQPGFIWGANASLVVYHKDIIQKIGLFDSHFFAYEEDVDLSLRLHNAGHQTLLIPSAISYHLGGGTSRKMGYFREMMDAKNWWLIILKNYSLKMIFLNFFPILEERLRNLSGLIKAVVRTDGLKSVYTLPIILFKTYFAVFKFLIENCKLKIVN